MCLPAFESRSLSRRTAVYVLCADAFGARKGLSSPMDSSKLSRRCAAFAALLATALVNCPAFAAPCAGLPSPFYGIGGSGPQQLFAKLGKALSAATPPQTLVYQAPGACLGVDAILNGTKMMGTATYWDATG